MKICLSCKSEYGGGEVFCPVDGSRLSSPSQMHTAPVGVDPLVGRTLSDRYKIIRQIGEGGMGIVYEAQHVVIEKQVALKVLRDDFSKRPEVVERFRQEAKSASRIGHEHIVDISDFGETPRGQSYFVMEYLDGEDLANILAREGTVAPDRAVDMVLQCCKALGAAHVKGIVHRDMKPENVFLVRRGERADFVKIVDFGIAKMSDIETDGAPGRKLTKTGMIFGTPEYMSPEQAAGKSLDHRVDIYALGVILFECLSGRVPFVGDTFMGILTQHMFEEPPTLRAVNPHVTCSDELELVIRKALAKNADERYQTMDELGRALATAMDISGVFGDSTVVGYGDPVKTVRRGPRLMDPERASSDEFPVAGGARSKARVVLALGAALALVGGVAAYVALTVEPTAANGDVSALEQEVGGDPQPDPVALGPAAVDTARDAGPAEAAAAAEPAGEGPQMVSIDIRTQPPGARIEVDGRGTVCEPSPCSFDTPAGQSVRIRARKGRVSAVRDLDPEQAMAVEMVLVRRVATTRQGDGEATGGMGSDAPPRAGDLKYPDIFR